MSSKKFAVQKLILTAFLVLLIVIPAGSALSTAAQASGDLVIFSGRREPLLTPILNEFKAQTGINVTVKFGETPELALEIVQLQSAGQPVPDAFIGDDAGTLEFFQREHNAFVPYTSPQIEKIPQRYRATDGSWMGVSGRSRVLIYNKSLIKPEDLPSTAFDFADPKWDHKLATTDGNDTDGFVPWVSALRLSLGDALIKEYLKALLANHIQIFTEQTDVRLAVGRGEFAVGLINNYYIYLQQRESDPAITNVGIFYQDQGSSQIGTLVNSTAAAIVKGAVNESNAQKFLDFLASPNAQQSFAELNFEYPLLPGVKTQPDVLSDVQKATGCTGDTVFDCIKQLAPSPAEGGAELGKTQQLLQEVSWF
ncbi:extracellular solute-binding protein [Candidatus Acetothermia bacterium]|nr:extracellular solute-binding protein [Candidatus Acetothermia bacterium]